MTAPAFIYTSEPWAALSFGRPIFDPNECRSFAQSSSASRFTAGIQVLHFEPIGRAAGLVAGILALRHNVFEAEEAELAIPLWGFCDSWRMFSPDHITGRFSCSDVAIRTRGGVRMGVETILLIVILTFVAGFVLDRLAMRRRLDAEKSKTKL
jgi:hypothetical protein